MLNEIANKATSNVLLKNTPPLTAPYLEWGVGGSTDRKAQLRQFNTLKFVPHLLLVTSYLLSLTLYFKRFNKKISPSTYIHNGDSELRPSLDILMYELWPQHLHCAKRL